MTMHENIDVRRASEFVWEIPTSGEMLVPGRIYADEELMEHLLDDVRQGKQWNALVQIRNVACLPGIQKASLAMADVHPGYGFAIGGVGAFDIDSGVVSVAGVGFDCNCGVRCLRTSLARADVEKQKSRLADVLFREIPAGLGSTGGLRLNQREIDRVLVEGARFAVERGFGTQEDLEFVEEGGCIEGARPDVVSDRAKERQFKQVGTLGSGNHYLEVQYVETVYDDEAARAYGLFGDQILVAIHCGSRALGHQIGTDYLDVLERASYKYKIPIREKELVCAPISSPEGQRYIAAVNCGINCAFANRQVLAHLTRQAFGRVLGTKPSDVATLYEIGHNTCKFERHKIDGMEKKLLVHRKGATRAFGPNRPEIPAAYASIGQPVLVGGTMGTASYILHGTDKAMEETFGTAVHGAGRFLSRQQAKRRWHGKTLVAELAAQGIIIRGHSLPGVAEEAPGAYKPVDQVVDVMHKAGLARKVVRVRPLISIKG